MTKKKYHVSSSLADIRPHPRGNANSIPYDPIISRPVVNFTCPFHGLVACRVIENPVEKIESRRCPIVLQEPTKVLTSIKCNYPLISEVSNGNRSTSTSNS